MQTANKSRKMNARPAKNKHMVVRRATWIQQRRRPAEAEGGKRAIVLSCLDCGWDEDEAATRCFRLIV